MEDAKNRLRRIVGDEGLRRLQASRVVVFGIGGVGSHCAEALIRGGIGHLGFVDGDTVQPSNMNRQAVAYQSTIGQRKVDVMEQIAQAIYADVSVTPVASFVTPDNVGSVFARLSDAPIDFVVDAIDTVTSKLAIIGFAQEHGIPVVSSMGGANKVDPTQFRFADIYQTQVCPLAKSVRKLAREQHLRGFPVLYSPEHPVSLSSESDAEEPGRRVLGTMSYVPPVMGYLLAGFVIRQLLQRSADQS